MVVAVAVERDNISGFAPYDATKRGGTMQPISFKRHRFPPDVIWHGVWLYFRFTLSVRQVVELLAQRGV